MPDVTLAITAPAHGAVVDGGAGYAVSFAGRTLSSGHPPLFYRWYSSLNRAADQDKVALNWSDMDASVDVRGCSAPLDVGSHVITLAAKDRAGDTLAEIEQVRYAGLAGGDAAAPEPCIVHVLRARISASQPTTLSRASAVLAAVAPTKWADADYQALNRIAYVWRFEPRGAPPNRRTTTLERPPLRFVPATADQPDPVVEYRGPLPGGTDLGPYTLVLRVQHLERREHGHEASIPVTIGA